MMKDCKKRKETYQKQLAAVKSNRKQNKLDPSQIEELCEEAKKVLESIDTENKLHVVRNLIDKVIIKSSREVLVQGHIALAPVNIGYVTTDRHSRIAECW